MRLTYVPLWELLLKKGITKKELIFRADTSQRTVQKMVNDEPVSLSTILKICTFLECRIEDVVKIVPDISLSEQEN